MTFTAAASEAILKEVPLQVVHMRRHFFVVFAVVDRVLLRGIIHHHLHLGGGRRQVRHRHRRLLQTAVAAVGQARLHVLIWRASRCSSAMEDCTVVLGHLGFPEESRSRPLRCVILLVTGGLVGARHVCDWLHLIGFVTLLLRRLVKLVLHG